ncbi:MAG: CHASE2 domain-containing protein [Candidatus Lambdaproteobacteria bacterium]|nr:CHASE2 domain-containing protein [Candidatus Lambdaproteobacteria bacterium]
MLKSFFKMSGFKLSLLITFVILGMFLYSTVDPTGNFLNLLDKKWVDFIMKGRGVQPHTTEVVIATIDTKSVDRYGRWPWPRARIAQLVQALNDYYEVNTIGLDIVFSEAEEGSGVKVTDDYASYFRKLGFSGSRAQEFITYLNRNKSQLDGDTQLGQMLKKKPNSVLGYFLFTSKEQVAHQAEEDLRASASRIAGSEISLLQGTIAKGIIPIGEAVESNIEKIYKGGTLSGFFNMQPDTEDGTVRRVHLLYEYKDNIYPSLDLQLLRHYFAADGISVVADENSGIVEIALGGNKSIYPNFDGSILLNYKGPQETFPHYSIYDIIEHNIPKEKLEGRIVLVGATEVGIFDLRTTPVGVAYPGVEVHATLLDNIITDSYFKLSFANDFFTALLILVIGLVLGVALPNLKSIYGSLLTLALLVGYVFAHRWMVMNWLSWTSAVFVVLVMIVVWGAVTLYRFLVTDKDKRFISGAFKQYLSPDVINQLMENPDFLKLGGERRVMTAFFSDVQGFSTISEKLEPEELVALLNVYLTEMSNIVMDYGGTVDKYEGDAIIAFVGAPVAYEDHALRACLMSLDMQKRLAVLRQQWLDEGKPKILNRIGLNTGPMVVGNMGSEKRFDYTMMGNSVNLAARLEGANKNYGTFTCMSEYTYEQAKDAVEVRELDLIRVIGINTPVRIYELVARKGELTEEQKKGFAYFAKGLQLYREQQWDEAEKYFNAVLKFIPDDPPATRYLKRCSDMKAKPPAPDWDGVFVATEK